MLNLRWSIMSLTTVEVSKSDDVEDGWTVGN